MGWAEGRGPESLAPHALRLTYVRTYDWVPIPIPRPPPPSPSPHGVPGGGHSAYYRFSHARHWCLAIFDLDLRNRGVQNPLHGTVGEYDGGSSSEVSYVDDTTDSD